MAPHPSPLSAASSSRRRFHALLVASAAPFAFAAAPAGPTPTAPAAARTVDETVVELSPFTVNATEDRGYQAENSLSGSRLRQDLKDLATPVTAFTEQFLLDTGITNTDDLAKYMVNTNYDLNEEANGQNGQITSIARPMKMRGLSGGDVTVNFFKIGSRTDTFSVERIEQARGPNAILFGIGSAGGLINVTTKKARLTGNSGSIAAQARSYEGSRFEGDYNQVVLPGKLAVRVAAVKSETGSWRNYAGNEATRFFGTVKYKPLPRLELNAEIERGSMDRRTLRTFTALDAYTPWRDAGRALSATASGPLGIATLGANPYVVFDTTSGALMNWRARMKTSNASNIGGLARVLTDFSVLPKETSITGPGYGQSQDYTRMMASGTYAFPRNWNLEVAVARNDEDVIINDNQQAFEQYLYADPNPTLPTGAVNPNAGRAYLESNPIRIRRDGRTDRARAIMSYQHDLGRWGRHTLAGVQEFGWNLNYANPTREYIVSPNTPAPTSPEAVGNRIYRRTYVNLNGPSSGIVMADQYAAVTSGLTEPVSGAVYQTAFIPFGAGTQITEARTRSTIGMLQSAFWKNRIQTTVGFSRDERRVYRSTQVRDPLPGFASGVLRAVRSHDGVADPATTNYTFSVVYHILPWVAATYSQARNNDVPNNTAAIMYGPDGVSLTRFKAAQGKSEDIGLKFDLLDRRLFLNAIYYQTSAAGDNEFASGVNNGDMNNLWGALNRDRVVNPLTGQIADAAPEASTAQTFDQRSQGYEVSLTANLTPHWRLVLGGSRSIASRTNIGTEMQAHLAAVRPLWEANRTRALATPSGDLQTIGDMLVQIDRQAQTNYGLADGRRPIGQVPFKFNLRTNYDVTLERLKGISVGGGVRYNGRPTIGFIPGSISASGAVTPFQYYKGSEQVFADINVSYRRKVRLLGRSTTWSIQLNVDNVFDNDAFVRMRVDSAGVLQNYRFNDPREWMLTTRLAF